MESYLKIVDFLETHIELVKVFLYGLSPIIGICFKDVRSVVVKFLNGIYFVLACPLRRFLNFRRNRNIFLKFCAEVGALPTSTQKLLFRFAAEGQYIEISNVKDLLRDILILHDKGWIHGLSNATPYTICIDIKLLPFTRKIAEQKGKQGI